MINELEFEPTTKYIQLDSYPANLYQGTIGDADNPLILENCRLIVTNDYAYGIIMEGTGPVFAFKEEILDFTYVPKQGFQINGADLDYVVVAVGNCGCGSRLRGMRLLPGVGHINIYKQKK